MSATPSAPPVSMPTVRTPTRTVPMPFNFRQWIEDNRHLLKPPVGNQVVYSDSEFIVMVVGGPNSRTDFHFNEGEEFYYQLEGDIVLKIHDGKKVVDVPIREGEIFLLPPKTPHSPRRPANTVGLVMERRRETNERDGFIWYCETCGAKLYEEYEHITNIVTQLPPIMQRYRDNEASFKCPEHGGTAPCLRTS